MARNMNPGALVGATGAGLRPSDAGDGGHYSRGGDARATALALGGRWHGSYGTTACPVCQPERRRDQTALSIATGDDGRLLLRCFKAGCSFVDILAAAGLSGGDWRGPDPAVLARRGAERRADAARRWKQARWLWQESRPIEGTPAERYLRGRGITCPLPATLRWHPQAWHGPTRRRHPAMVALVEGGDACALHRTFLRPDGSGKAELPGGDKLMLGATAGGAARLWDGPDARSESGRLVVAEGAESALALLCGLLEAPAGAAIWAALSTSGMRGLRLPPQPGRLTVACDGDAPGRAAAHALAERAHAEGWTVGILDPGTGRDFNDMLRGEVAA